MSEFQVWKSVIEFGKVEGWRLEGGCPPGGSPSNTRRCCLTNPRTRKQDEPDLFFVTEECLLFVECKGTHAAAIGHKSKTTGETDYQKLEGLRADFGNGDYSEQLKRNYDLVQDDYRVEFSVAYGGSKVINEPDFPFIHAIAISKTGNTILSAGFNV